MKILKIIRNKYFLIGILVIVLLGAIAWGSVLVYSKFQNNSSAKYDVKSNSQEPADTGEVKKIIDPITIQLTSGHIIRYVGVRNPDVTSEVRCFGKEAMLANESMIGKKIRMEKEPLINRSNDGAYLRYVFFEDPKKPEETEVKEILVNERILEMGLGFPLVSKDMKYGERMISSAKYASATGKGLWSQCKVDSKETANGTYFTTQKIEDCIIKGKVNVDGKKIYRIPECPAYVETMVIQAEGGKWFCAEDTAREASFEKAEDCK